MTTLSITPTTHDWVSAEELYTNWMDHLPPDMENIIWEMMPIKAPLMNAYELGVRVLHVPVDEKPRIVNIYEDAEEKPYKQIQKLVGGSFDAMGIEGDFSLYMQDYDLTGPINRFIFKHLGLVVRGDVVIVRNDDDDGEMRDYAPLDWKKAERHLIKRGHRFHYIYKSGYPAILEELHLADLIDFNRKRL